MNHNVNKVNFIDWDSKNETYFDSLVPLCVLPEKHWLDAPALYSLYPENQPPMALVLQAWSPPHDVLG